MTKDNILFLAAGILIGLIIAGFCTYWRSDDSVAIENSRLKVESKAYADTAHSNAATAIKNYEVAEKRKASFDCLLLIISQKEKLIRKYENENRNHWTASDYQSYYDRELSPSAP